MTITVQDIINSLTEPVPKLEQTVDKLLIGRPDDAVAGIATVFMPTRQALEEAVALGANVVIAHEGPFYSHQDSFAATLEDDPVYQAKKTFLAESGLALFRLHDYIHRTQPDGITEGLVQALGWERHVLQHQPAASIVELPPMTAMEVASHVKERLGLAFVRLAGQPDMPCRRIGLLAGYRGGGPLVIPLFESEKLDLVLYGEGPEWETPEYVRDAVRQGHAKALIALGHAESESAGMRLLAERLQRQFPQLPVHFIPNEPLFRSV
ncbi:Nif3-like dinuclear metal center hexameric protein [Paenibacillus soyae]|uniref:GTP cyclohydrolase 1 type 2 homolog n=1 Tax=Paenibacillus soyae TaxID=2969249 RepID=A0A9X2MUR8_9BACL|nr:Nif3-like dinuclear metal center hexameric protein [Paenibacillus soyae]MCR2806905.1 Nif3-like dinuclear metal center hexameric protein [Paenibacillus soyae]